MLNPKFFRRPPEIPQAATYKVLRYAQAGNYTLIHWEVSMRGEAQYGESLYEGFVLKASSGGQLVLYTETPQSSQSIVDQRSPFELLDSAIGRYGIPVRIARDLRKGSNSFDINVTPTPTPG